MSELSKLVEQHEAERHARNERLNRVAPLADRVDAEVDFANSNPHYGAELDRLARLAEAKAQKHEAARDAILRETTSIEGVRNGELTRWLDLHGYITSDASRTRIVKPGTAEVLLAELQRTQGLEAKFQAEVAAQPPGKPFSETGQYVDLRGPVEWKWSRMDLFGAEQGGGISTNPVWERPTASLTGKAKKVLGGEQAWEVCAGMPRDSAVHAAEGWTLARPLPDFSTRRDALLALLDHSYRASDLPQAVVDLREKWRDLVLERSDLVEANRALIRRANICPSRFTTEVAAYQAKVKALEVSLGETRKQLGALGFGGAFEGWLR